MSKSILLIKEPKTCFDCPCFYDNEGMSFCQAEDKLVDVEQGKPSWCPLRPLPEMKDADILAEFTVSRIFNTGWNACIKAIITGKTK